MTNVELTRYRHVVASSFEEQLASIEDITALIDKTARLAEELSQLLQRFKL
ncbi:hypothetical protein Pryu01_01334 [Paraliobacillus ryukyuensis]|uniref:Uncharacterized protein n=1 Tax=Paraliobacillus ryukyuensis TaxID=200904 RepID=A0A366ED58_9BACI|nr:hypothetical protein [Paraliobacillus ryukyuensis]RBO99434.1 hypothetical protein DES48_104106 [Paraliobacillus ryukyuensis]